MYRNLNKHKSVVCTGMTSRHFDEFRDTFHTMVDGLLEEGRDEEEEEDKEMKKKAEERREGEEDEEEEKEEEGGRRRRSEKSSKSSKTDSESHSSDDSGSDSSDDSALSTNQIPSNSHVTKMVSKATTEARRLANQISELEVYDPSYREVTHQSILHLFSEIVNMKDRLHEAQLLQEVGHVISGDMSCDVM